MRQILWLEQFGLMLLGFWLCYQQPLSFRWYSWILLFLLPDIGMIGYALNTRVGAITYNLLHHAGVAVALVLAGNIFSIPLLYLFGALMLCHSAFDRLMGYGLKYADSFQHTHLGMIGKNKEPRD